VAGDRRKRKGECGHPNSGLQVTAGREKANAVTPNSAQIRNKSENPKSKSEKPRSKAENPKPNQNHINPNHF